MITRRVADHDRNQLELKLGYRVAHGARRQAYRVSTFVFVPRTLGVDEDVYDANSFFGDVSSFVRLSTPVAPLRHLAMPAAEREQEHCLRTLEEALDAHAASASRDAEPVSRLLKVVGCTYRGALREESVRAAEALRALDREADHPELATARAGEAAQRIEGFVVSMGEALAALRHAGGHVEQAGVGGLVRDTWHAVDEYVSLVAEERLTELVDLSDELLHTLSNASAARLREARAALAGAAVAEYRRRRALGYTSWVGAESPDGEAPDVRGEDGDAGRMAAEGFAYRRRVLKRIVSSALYLRVERAEGPRFAQNIGPMLAAAAAMLFAILVLNWATARWSAASPTFVTIIVGSYIIKDRIKEWGRAIAGRRLERTAPDRLMDVRDSLGRRTLGQMRESFSVVRPSAVPQAVRALRHADHTSQVATDGRPEVVLAHRKTVSLRSDALATELSGLRGVTDVVRLDFHRLRQRMDAPEEPYRFVHPASGDVLEARCPRVYHLNVVLHLETLVDGQEASDTIERVRIILDQRGIQRVEHVGWASPAGASGLAVGQADTHHAVPTMPAAVAARRARA